MPISGTDLKVERIKAKVKMIDLAARMGVSRQTLWGIERAGHIDKDQAKSYRDALLTFDEVMPGTEGSTAA